MFFFKKNKKSRAQKLEAKGDEYAQKEKWEKALKAYQSSLEMTPDNLPLYDKMIEIKMRGKAEWSEKDFSESLEWTMKKQELENPALKAVHETLSPEYLQIRELIFQILETPPELREPLIQKMNQFEKSALRPLLDVLLNFYDRERKD